VSKNVYTIPKIIQYDQFFALRALIRHRKQISGRAHQILAVLIKEL